MKPMINVGVDGTCMRQPRTGVGTYTFSLVNHISEGGVAIRILDGSRYRPISDYADDYSTTGAHGRDPLHTLTDIARKSQLLRKLYRGFINRQFTLAVSKLDIFHATNFLPARKIDIPVLPLIHDVSHLRHPEWHPAQRVELLTSRADEFTDAPLINTVSQFSADEIVDTLSIPAELIRITPPGTNPVYFGKPDQAEPLLKQLDLAPGGFFLSVGTQEPRKNLATLLQAYIDYCGRNAATQPLVIVGPQGWGDLNLPEGTDALQRSGNVRFLGYVPERVMHVLYANATAFLYPSLYEGFGMPVAEAMAAGTRPIIAAGGAPEEVAGPDGLTAPALDVAAWSAAMLRAVDENWFVDAERRSGLSRRASTFTWEENAASTLAIYHEIAGIQQAT